MNTTDSTAPLSIDEEAAILCWASAVRDFLSADDAISFAFVLDEAGQELAQYELKAARA